MTRFATLLLFLLAVPAALAQPTVTLSANPTTISEDGGTSTIMATLSAATTENVTVTLGAAGDADAFNLASTTISIPAGQTTGSTTLDALEDADAGDEAVTVSIESVDGSDADDTNDPTENGTQQVTITISDDEESLVTLSASPTAITEGQNSTITATLSAPVSENVTVTLGAAGDAGAYSLTASTIAIPAGQTTGSTTLRATQDADFNDATATVSIQSVQGSDGTAANDPTEDGNQQATVTITDDDVPGVVLLANPRTITEGQTSTLTAQLVSGATADGAVTVNLAFSGGAGRYTSPNQIVIPDGQSSASITFTANDDTVFNGDVNVDVSISSVSGDGTEQGNQVQTITIRENDTAPPSVRLLATRNQVNEDGGTATLTARLSRTVTTATTVTLVVTSGDPDAYDLEDTSLTIPAGQLAATTTFTGTPDDDFNNDEVVVEINTVSGSTAVEDGRQLQRITVLDDDVPAITLSLDDDTLVEGDSTRIRVRLPAGVTAEGDITVRLGYLYDDGDDDPSDNPNEVTGPASIVIPSGENAAVRKLFTVEDTQDEVEGELTVSITGVSGNGAEDGDQEATLTVVDDDDAPEVSFEAVPSVIAESNGTSQLTLSLTNTSDRRVGAVLSYFGSASRTSDYTAPDTVFVAPGQLTGSAPLRSIGGDDNNEQIFIQVVEVLNGTEAGGPNGQQEFVTLNPDLNQITAEFADAELDASEDDEAFEVEVTLTPAPEQAASVRVVLDADASTGTAADLGGVTSRTATFAAGETTATVSFPITDDALFEGEETFVFRLANGSGAVASDDSLTVTIADNDTDSELFVSEFDAIVSGGDPEFVELVAAGGGALADGLSLVFYDADSTAVVVNDLDGLATDDDGFLVVTDDDAGISIPDTFLGVAVVRGNGPALGSRFNPADPTVIDAVFIDEQAAADEQGLAASTGSLQLQDRGGFAFVAPPTPGEANGFGAGVAVTPGPNGEPAVGDVFPNPSAGRAAVEFAVSAGQHVRVEVFDALGRSVLVAYEGDVRPGGSVRVPLAGRALTPGVYVVRVAGETFSEARQLTVTR